ncbi:hypothetical protein AB1Y20_015484 [Prymnesium parvum]|uniref:DNA-directed primase/polymerase protein n=1 Tax=Prymnesium parvum TaxID=97485 RepID=A0AB34JXB2_PRYPA
MLPAHQSTVPPAKRKREQGGIQRVELFLGGVHSSSLRQLSTYLRCIAQVHGKPFDGILRISHKAGCGRATLIGEGAALGSLAALGRRLEKDRLLAEVQLHNDWYCPCGRSGERPLKHVQRCPHCSQARPASLLDALIAEPVHEPAVDLHERDESTLAQGKVDAIAPAVVPEDSTTLKGRPSSGEEPSSLAAVQREPTQSNDFNSLSFASVAPAALHAAATHARSSPPPQHSSPLPLQPIQPSLKPSHPKLWRSLCPDEAWDAAAGRGALTWKDPRVTIYRKLDACLELCKQNGDSVRAWAYDLPKDPGSKGGAPKRYIAASVFAFAEAYAALPPDMRNAYEVISAARPCWPYFDLEYARDETKGGGGLNSSADGDAMTQLVIEKSVAVIQEEIDQLRSLACGNIARSESHTSGTSRASPSDNGGMSEKRTPKDGLLGSAEIDGRLLHGRLEVDVLALDSHRPAKFSRHLILRPHLLVEGGSRAPLPLAGSATAGVLARTVCSRLGSALEVRSSSASEASCFVDLGVYTRSRCFRLVGSSKLASPAVLSLNSQLSQLRPSSRILIESSISTQLRETLVVPELESTGYCTLKLTSVQKVAPASSRCATLNRQPPVPSGLCAVPSAIAPAVPVQYTRNIGEGQTSVEQWEGCWRHITSSPLLDFSSLGPAHPFVRCALKGSGSPPHQFNEIERWAVQQFGQWGTGHTGTVCKVLTWKYLRSEHPVEILLHLTARGTRYCFARGRPHKNQSVMLSVDLIGRRAWQRCWDSDCVTLTREGEGSNIALKSKHELERPPPDAVPSLPVLMHFEAEHSTPTDDAHPQECSMDLQRVSKETTGVEMGEV